MKIIINLLDFTFNKTLLQVEGDIRSESDESDIENSDIVINNATSYAEKRSHTKKTR